MRCRLGLLAVLLTLAAVSGADARPRLGVASGTYADAGDTRRLSSVGATWAYDWSAESRLDRTGTEFVPMAWGAAGASDVNVARWSSARREGRARWLLGFNEPDLAEQANMSPAATVALWPRLERTGLRLVSPAVASPYTRSQSNPERRWLDDFMQRARTRRLRVDAIALHFYGDWTDPGAIARIERDLRMVHGRWRRPIWITEIGTLPAWRWENRRPLLPPTQAGARRHLQRVMAMLDRLPFVHRVAWFMDRCSGDCARTALFDARGSRTAMGRALARAARGELPPGA